MEQTKTKKITLWYLLITFVIMGFVWGGILIAQHYGYLKRDSIMFFPLFILGGASTTIASFLVLIKSGVSVKEWFANVFGVKQSPFSYLIVFLFLVCYTVLGFLTGSFTLYTPLGFLFLFGIQNIVAGGLEQAGWSYILLPNLEKSMPFGFAALIFGSIWVLWHLPLFFMDATIQQNMNFGIYFIFMLGYAFSLAAIKRLTGSVWLCVLFHASLNAVLTVFALDLSLSRTIIISLVIIILSLVLVNSCKSPHKKL